MLKLLFYLNGKISLVEYQRVPREAVVCRCSSKQLLLILRHIHRKAPVLKYLFNKLIKKRLQRRCFLVNIAKFLRTAFFIKHRGGCFWSLPLPFEIIIKKTFQLFSFPQSILSQMFFKKGILKNLHKFRRKHLCWSPFLI